MATTTQRALVTTQLARVRTPTPRLLALHTTRGDARTTVRVVAQVRPTLLHYLRDGELMCVVKSHDEICGVAQCGSQHTSVQLMVATRSGSLWVVRLPSTPMGFQPLVLKDRMDDSSIRGDASVRRIGIVPGAQQLYYLANRDTLICTSLLVPTTVIQGTIQGATPRTFEIEDLEGERSTSIVAFPSDGSDHPRLVSWLLASAPASEDVVVIVQGDVDGVVRCAVVDSSSSRLVGHVQQLVRLPEAIHTICPVRLHSGVGADALLVVGVLGSIALVSRGLTYPHVLYGRVGVSVTSVAIMEGDENVIAISTTSMEVIVITTAQMLPQLKPDVRSSVQAETLKSSANTLSKFQDVVSLTAHQGTSTILSLLTASGRFVSILDDSIFKCLNSPTKAPVDVVPTDIRVKFLLHDISQLSRKSAKLQGISERADQLLNGLDSALQFVRLIESYPISSLVTCSLRLKLRDAGWALEARGVYLSFTVRLSESLQLSDLISSGMWRFQVTVRTTSGDIVSSYGFPLSDCVATQRYLELDRSVLQQQDGVVQVSCEMVFAPGVLEFSDLETKQEQQECHLKLNKLASFGIPVVRAKELHLVQLCEPASEFPVNPVAVRDRFTAAYSVGADGGDRHGYQWWTTLFDDTAVAGIALSPHEIVSGRKPTPPPLRVVIRILCDRITSESGAAMDLDDVMSLIARFIPIESDVEREQWRQACRLVNGRWWVGMKAFPANLIVLRLASVSAKGSEADHSSNQEFVEVTTYASDIADLTAMRAVILNACASREVADDAKPFPHRHPEVARVSVELMKTRTELDSLATIVADIYQKIGSVKESEGLRDSLCAVNLCQDELLQLLHRTSQAETVALELYWKYREVLSQHLTF